MVVSVGLGEEVVRPLAVFGERSGGVVLFGVGRESRGTSIDGRCTRRGPVVSVLRGVGPDGKAVGLDRREVHPSGTGGVREVGGRTGKPWALIDGRCTRRGYRWEKVVSRTATGSTSNRCA